MASIVLGGIGAGIGSFFGAAMLGWAVGNIAGGLLFPPRQGAQDVGKQSNLQIQSSAYGTFITQIYGTMRTPGNVIWGTPLQEVKKSTGGKTTPKVTTYTYFANVAVMVCKGPVVGINKIYANDVLIYDSTRAAGLAPSKEKIRVYNGTEAQMPDSLITADKGAGNVSAHRGYCYVVFENLAVAKYGNSLPNFSFEVNQSGSGTVSLSDYMQAIGAQVGLSTTQMDTSQGTDRATGFFISGRQTAANALTQVLSFYSVDMADVDGKLRLIKRGGDPVATISLEEMGASTQQGDTPRLEVRRAQDVELPTEVDVSYFGQANAFQQVVQSAVRQTKPNCQDTLTVDMPAVLGDDQARQGAERLLYTAWRERTQFRTTIPPRYLWIAPGDIINLPVNGFTQRVRVNDIDVALFGQLAITCVLDDSAALSQQVAIGAPISNGSASVSLDPIPTSFAAFGAKADGTAIELFAADGFDTGFYVQGGPTGNVSGWQGATVYYSPDAGVSWITAGLLSDTEAVGTATSVLATYTGANPDSTDSVNVALVTGTLEPASASEVASGLNQAVLGVEAMGYAGAALTSANHYTLSGFTRAEVSTLTTGHASGEQFCTVGSGTLRVVLPDTYAGSTVLVKCVSPYQVLSDVVAESVLIGTKSGGPGVGAIPVVSASPTTPIAATGAVGTETTFSAGDHTHEGVHSFQIAGDTFTTADHTGDIILGVAGSITATRDGTNPRKIILTGTTSGSGGSGNLQVAQNGALVGTEPRINLTSGPGITLTVTDNSANSRVDINIDCAPGVLVWTHFVVNASDVKALAVALGGSVSNLKVMLGPLRYYPARTVVVAGKMKISNTFTTSDAATSIAGTLYDSVNIPTDSGIFSDVYEMRSSVNYFNMAAVTRSGLLREDVGDNVYLNVVVTGGLLNNLTTGTVDVWLLTTQSPASGGTVVAVTAPSSGTTAGP